MTEFIDFNIYVEKPRQEYVGIMRAREPDDLDGFLRQVEEAALAAVVRYRIRYDRHPRWFRLLVQRGKSHVSTVTVRVENEAVRIAAWSAPRNSSLFELMAQWRLMKDGQVASYYEYLDKPSEESENMERLLFRESNVGMLTPKAAMRGATSSKMKKEKTGTLDMLRNQKRIRAP